MVVAFTSNLGLAKPDGSELAANWTNFSELQKDNNDLIQAAMTIPITGFTTALTANTTPPSVGAGNSSMQVAVLQDFVWITFRIQFEDPGISSGSGEFGLMLPYTIDNTFHTVNPSLATTPGTASIIGEGYLYDASTVATCGSLALDCCTVSGISYVRFLTETYTAPVKATRVLTNNSPITFADGDRIGGQIFYKRLV